MALASALYHGATREHIKKLLDAGADVNERNPSSMTALMYAAFRPKYNEGNVVGMLMEYGAEVNAKDRYGMTALTYAADAPFSETISREYTVKILLENEADVSPKTFYGYTALKFAVLNVTKAHTILTITMLIEAIY